MAKPLDELLRQYGLVREDFPVPLRINPALIWHVEYLPHEMRAGYLDALRQFFCVFHRLDESQRARIVKQLEYWLQHEFEWKRWDH